jgi:cytochrome b561
MTAAAPAAATTAAPAQRSAYSSVAISLHWLIAALILTNIGLAWYFGSLPHALRSPPTQLHKSIGITVLLLSLVRVGWRLTHAPPPLPASMPVWERWAAQTLHTAFYVFMIAMPLSGWAMVSASPLIKVHPTVLYGIVAWPAFPYPGFDPDALHAARNAAGLTHESLAFLAYAMIALHVGAALKHQFFQHDEVLGRMIPWLRPKAGRAA